MVWCSVWPGMGACDRERETGWTGDQWKGPRTVSGVLDQRLMPALQLDVRRSEDSGSKPFGEESDDVKKAPRSRAWVNVAQIRKLTEKAEVGGLRETVVRSVHSPHAPLLPVPISVCLCCSLDVLLHHCQTVVSSNWATCLLVDLRGPEDTAPDHTVASLAFIWLVQCRSWTPRQ